MSRVKLPFQAQCLLPYNRCNNIYVRGLQGGLKGTTYEQLYKADAPSMGWFILTVKYVN